MYRLTVADHPILHLSIPVEDLDATRDFYESVLDCRIGRVREDWLDVWFFGLQLTLHRRPAEVRPAGEQGVRHFGVVLEDRERFDRIVERVHSSGIPWLTEPETHAEAALSGKLGGKLADPSGNIIEIKFYEDASEFLSGTHAERLVTERDRTVVQVESLRRSFDDIVAASEQVATDDEHDPEGHTIAWERQQVAALLAAAEVRLGELESAMRRVAEGTYGRCWGCGRTIAPDRLDALPTTTACVACAT